MEFIKELFLSSALDGPAVAHSILILSLVIAFGIMLGKIKIAGISFGVTGVLFIGIIFSHFGLNIDANLQHFIKELGLILFVYSIGLQVGPGFFSSFRKGGVVLNKIAFIVIFLGIITTVVLYYCTGLPMSTMVGIMSGAVTNTPGLGAAQQTFNDLHLGMDAPNIATGYAVAYPLGVIGSILIFILLRYILKINTKKEEKENEIDADQIKDIPGNPVSIEVTNPALDGKTIQEIQEISSRNFIISRICHQNDTQTLVNADTKIKFGDKILVVAAAKDIEAIEVLIGRKVEMDWMLDTNMISRRFLITKPELNGKKLADLRLRNTYGITITRINRSGIDLVAAGNLQLQIGDRVTVVGLEPSVLHAEQIFGNSMKRLNHPNLIPIFIGIAIGVLVGSIPFWLPGIPQPMKLGLAGGPLIVAILIGRYGPKYRMVTYTTMSANLMLREIGISLFLAAVGLGAGSNFISTIYNGGYIWILYGALITVIPLFITGLIGKLYYKINYYTLTGVLAGASTNPPALAFINEQTNNDAPAVGYATVYPLSMFLRVLIAQLLILLF